MSRKPSSTIASAPRSPSRGARSTSLPACAGRAWRCRSRSTTSTSGCCATASPARRRAGARWLEHRRLRHRRRRDARGVGRAVRDRTRRPAGAARHRHPHAPRPHRLANWLCERWNARLWISATDFAIARIATSASAGFGGPLSAAFMAVHGLAADPAAVDGVRRGPTTTATSSPPCRRRIRRLLDGRSRPARRRAPTGPATPATATRPSTWRCTARRRAC